MNLLNVDIASAGYENENLIHFRYCPIRADFGFLAGLFISNRYSWRNWS